MAIFLLNNGKRLGCDFLEIGTPEINRICIEEFFGKSVSLQKKVGSLSHNIKKDPQKNSYKIMD